MIKESKKRQLYGLVEYMEFKGQSYSVLRKSSDPIRKMDQILIHPH